MHDQDAIEERLTAFLHRSSSPDNLATLDLRVKAAVRGRHPARRTQLARSLALGLALLLVVPLAVVAAAALSRSTEAPFGLSSASDYQAELDSAMAVVPIPPNAVWPSFHVDPSAHYSTRGGQSQVEAVSFCLWSDYWLRAHLVSDAQGEQQALAIFEALPSWSAYTNADQSYRNVVDKVVAAAAIGSEAPVRRFIELNCHS